MIIHMFPITPFLRDSVDPAIQKNGNFIRTRASGRYAETRKRQRDDFRRLLCLMGVKLQQLSRMTGISYETINKAKNDCWNLRNDKDEHLIYNG